MKNLSAITFRNILTTLLVLAILLSGAGFYFAFSWIKTFTGEVNQVVITAHSSAVPNNAASSQALQAIAAQQASLTGTFSKFYVASADFPGKPIQDINTYASKSGLSIGDVSLGDGSATTTATTTTTPTRTPAGTAPTSATSGGSLLTVKLKTPVSYTSLLKFSSYIQASLPKMQIQGLTLQHNTGGGADSVMIDSITIKVETR